MIKKDEERKMDEMEKVEKLKEKANVPHSPMIMMNLNTMIIILMTLKLQKANMRRLLTVRLSLQ